MRNHRREEIGGVVIESKDTQSPITNKTAGPRVSRLCGRKAVRTLCIRWSSLNGLLFRVRCLRIVDSSPVRRANRLHPIRYRYRTECTCRIDQRRRIRLLVVERLVDTANPVAERANGHRDNSRAKVRVALNPTVQSPPTCQSSARSTNSARCALAFDVTKSNVEMAIRCRLGKLLNRPCGKHVPAPPWCGNWFMHTASDASG